MSKENEKLSAINIINQTIGSEFKDDLSPDKWMNYAIKSMYQYAAQQCAEKDKEIERLADQMNVDTEKIIAFDETIRKYELLKQKADKLLDANKELNRRLDIEWNKPSYLKFKDSCIKKISEAQQACLEAITNYEKQECND